MFHVGLRCANPTYGFVDTDPASGYNLYQFIVSASIFALSGHRCRLRAKAGRSGAGPRPTPGRRVEPPRRDRGRRRPQRPRLRRLARPSRPSRAGVRAPPHRGRSVRGVRVLPRLPRLHHQFPGVAGAQGGGGPGARAPRADLHPPGPDADVPVPRRPRVRRVARPRPGRGADPPVLGEGRRRLCRAVRLPQRVRRTPRRLAARAAPDAPGAGLPSGDAGRRGGVRQGVPRQRRRPARRVPGVRAPEVDARDAGGHVELAEPVLPRLRDVADDAADVARIVERGGRARSPRAKSCAAPPGCRSAAWEASCGPCAARSRPPAARCAPSARSAGSSSPRSARPAWCWRTGRRSGPAPWSRTSIRGRRTSTSSTPRTWSPASAPRSSACRGAARRSRWRSRSTASPTSPPRRRGWSVRARDASSGSRRASSTRTGRSRTRSTAARRGVRCSGGCSRPWRDPTLAPPGRHILSANIFHAPNELREGSWATERDRFGERCIDVLEEYLPGLGDRIVERRFWSPADLEAEFGLPGANITHLDMTPRHMFGLRPAGRILRLPLAHRGPLQLRLVHLAGWHRHRRPGAQCEPAGARGPGTRRRRP